MATKQRTRTEAPPFPEVGAHVYAVIRAADGLPDDLTGIDDAPLRMVTRGAVAAVVNDIRIERPPGRRADLVAYSRVLDTLAAAGPAVPVRFGSVLPDDDAVDTAVLLDREDYLEDRLGQLAGRSQLQLRASYHEGLALREIVAADPAVAELRARTRDLPEDVGYADRVRLGELVARALDDKRQQDADMLLAAVAGHVLDLRVELGTDTDQVARISLLVDDDRRGDLEDHLEALAEVVHERIRLGLVGPMAAYDFAGEA